MAKDYYNILGVSKTASDDEIKRAYRKMAHQHHPDKGGDQEKFKEINEAYQVLGNAEKRHQFDQYGQTFEQAGQQGGGAGGFGFDPFGGQGFNVNYEDFGNFGDIFSQFFGGSRAGSRGRADARERARGTDLQIDMAISFHDMVFGTKREISLNRFRTCKHCKGNLAEPGTKIVSCKTCGGNGYVRTQVRTILGTMVQDSVCSECHGEGKKAETKCSECRGEGRTRQMETLVVKIPAGVDTGTRIRLTGEGEAPKYGGDLGDLYINLTIKEDKKFSRKGNDIFSQISVSFAVAALGGRVQVETADDLEILEIPKGTQPGQEFRLTGKGIVIGNSERRGDQRITVNVEVPKKLSKKQEEILREFEEAGKKKSFFG
jgi:molecular chaperone DnaJ